MLIQTGRNQRRNQRPNGVLNPLAIVTDILVTIFIHTSVVKDVWEESQLIEEILKLSQICRWDIGVGGTEEA